MSQKRPIASERQISVNDLHRVGSSKCAPLLSLLQQSALLPVFAALTIVAIAYGPMLTAGSPGWDQGDWTIGAFRQEWLRKSLFTYGVFPLRCHFVGGGYPMIGDPEDPTLNPLTWCLLPFSSEMALKLRFFLLALLGACGMYLLAHNALGLVKWGAFYAALLFPTALWIPWQVRGGNYMEPYPLLVPLCLFLLLTAPRRPWRFALVAVLMYTILSDGKQQLIVTAIFLSIVCTVWWAQGGTKRWMPLALVALALVFTFLIGMMRILPAVEVMSERGGLMYADVPDHGMPYAHDTFGRFMRNVVGFQGRDWEGDLFHVGLLPVLLFLAGLAFAWRKLLAWAVVTLIFIWLLLGENAPFDLLSLFIRLPFCNLLDRPAKWLAPYIVLAVTIGGAACFGQLTSFKRRWLRTSLAALATAGTILPLIPEVVYMTTQPFTQLPPTRVVGKPRDFYNVALMGEAPGAEPKEANCYFNLLHNIGTIDWYAGVPLPTRAQPRYFIDAQGKRVPNPDYSGEAYLEHGAGSCTASFEPNRIILDAEIQEPDVLIVNQNFHPGWRTDHGVLEERDGLLAVRLDRPGLSAVTLRYSSIYFNCGLVVTALGLALLVAFVALWRRGQLAFLHLSDTATLSSLTAQRRSQVSSGIISACIVVGVLLPKLGVGFVDRSAIKLVEQGESLAAGGAHQRAMEMFQRAWTRDPCNYQALTYLATDCASRGQYDRAIQYWTQAVRLVPSAVAAYYNRGAAYSRKQDYQRAVQDYSRVIALRADFAPAYLDRGAVYVKLGQVKQAIEDFNRAVALEPDNAWAYLFRGSAHAANHAYRRARRDWQRAVEHDPNGPAGDQARTNLAALQAEGD